MEAKLADKAIPSRVGPYVLLQRLGRGGMGRVFKAEHRLMKRVVALKLTGQVRGDATVLSRFRREVEALGRLRHPNIVTAYDAGVARGQLYLAMEYVEGVDLERLVRASGPLTVDLACEIIRQTAEALEHAHRRGLVHRDLKPANLMLAPPGVTIKMLDLGLAQWTNDASATDGELCGTPDFMAPEWGHDPRRADIRADLYSLGCTFYYLLTAQVPYPGGNWTEKLLRHSFEEPAELSALRPDLPPAVVRVVQRLMAREVEDRYASAAAVALDVAALCSHRPVLQRVESKKSTTPPPRRSRRLARFLFAALAFALLGGAAGSGAHRMLVPPPGTSSRSQTPRSGSFTIEGQAAAFASLEKAINAANDGDIITIHGSGPFRLTPLAWQGKALTIRAAHGVRPRLEMKPGDAPWQALLQTDRDLNLEGLDLAITEETPIAAGSAAPPLLCCRQAPLSLTNCRLTGGTAATAISARNAGNISLRGCVIEAGAVALSLEVGQQGPGRLELIDCRLNVRAEAGAALCLWGEEGGQAVPVELSLQGNTIQAGRIAALRDRPVHLTIAARDNQFRYRTALLSFSGCANRAVWRDTLWQGGGNRYEGPASWFWVDGRPVAPTPLPVAR